MRRIEVIRSMQQHAINRARFPGTAISVQQYIIYMSVLYLDVHIYVDVGILLATQTHTVR